MTDYTPPRFATVWHPDGVMTSMDNLLARTEYVMFADTGAYARAYLNYADESPLARAELVARLDLAVHPVPPPPVVTDHVDPPNPNDYTPPPAGWKPEPVEEPDSEETTE